MPTITKYPQSNDNGWPGSPSNAYADDGVYANSGSLTLSGVSAREIYFHNFALNLPSNALNVVITIYAKFKVGAQAGGSGFRLQAYLGAVAKGSSENDTSEPLADTIKSTSDVGTWAVADLNDNTSSGFRIRAYAYNNTYTAFITYLDYVKVTVEYDEDYSIQASATFTGIGVITVGVGNVYKQIYFLQDPKVVLRMPIATHVIVGIRDTLIQGSAHIEPEPGVATKIERYVEIDEGTEEICNAIAAALIEKWGRNQKSVQGMIPLNVQLDFMGKIFISIPEPHIAELMPLQKKEHDVLEGTTVVTLGDIILDDDELIARMLEDLLNK